MSKDTAPAQPTPPRMNVLSQYVQRQTFENHAAKRGANPAGKPSINVQVNVDAAPLGQDRHRVSLIMTVTAKSKDAAVFDLELDYSGIFMLQNVPENAAKAALMIEAPRLLFPFARRIIAEVSRDGGYPPLMLDPIDFAALYRRRLTADAANGAAPGDPADAPALTAKAKPAKRALQPIDEA